MQLNNKLVFSELATCEHTFFFTLLQLFVQGVVNFNQTKGFNDVADAPSFSLGLTDDEDSQETHRGHLVKYVPSIEDEKLYNEICKHNRLHGGQDNRHANIPPPCSFSFCFFVSLFIE